jgi:hypothetical protein
MFSHSIWKVKPAPEPVRSWQGHNINKLAPFASAFLYKAFLETEAKFHKGQFITWASAPSLVNAQYACVILVLDIEQDSGVLSYDNYTGLPKYLYLQSIYLSNNVSGQKKWDDEKTYRVLTAEEVEWVKANDLIQNRIKETAPNFVPKY